MTDKKEYDLDTLLNWTPGTFDTELYVKGELKAAWNTTLDEQKRKKVIECLSNQLNNKPDSKNEEVFLIRKNGDYVFIEKVR